jgi:hypothetical protein
MDDTGVLEAARAIRPYLRELVGPAADELDRGIADLLNAGPGEQVSVDVRSLLESDETTGDFLAEVLADAPHYRPPKLQPGYVRRGGGYQALAGDVEPVLHTGKYACPHGDYVWYRPAVGTPIPPCPTHGPILIRT